MYKILVTGGAGYIGSHTCVALHKVGFFPVIVDDLRNSEPQTVEQLRDLCDQQLSFYQFDCSNMENLISVFEKEQGIVGVIHFAAYKAVGESVAHPTQYFENNVQSLVVLMNCMNKYGIENLIFSSSCTVYGEPEKIPVTENSKVKIPKSPYGFTKLANEQLIQYQYEADKIKQAVTLRYFNPIGAHPSGKIGELPLGTPDNLVPFITQTAAGVREQLTVFGNDYNTDDGTCIRDYLHVMDLAEAHVAALNYSLKEEETHEIFNLGMGKGISVLDIIRTFETVSDQKLIWEHGARRLGDVEKIYADVSKAKKILGWQCRFTIEEALEHAWQWQQNLSKN